MPHVIVIVAGAVSLFFALRWVRREAERVDASLRRAERRIRREHTAVATPLTLDAATGVYKPLD